VPAPSTAQNGSSGIAISANTSTNSGGGSNSGLAAPSYAFRVWGNVENFLEETESSSTRAAQKTAADELTFERTHQKQPSNGTSIDNKKEEKKEQKRTMRRTAKVETSNEQHVEKSANTSSNEREDDVKVLKKPSSPPSPPSTASKHSKRKRRRKRSQAASTTVELDESDENSCVDGDALRRKRNLAKFNRTDASAPSAGGGHMTLKLDEVQDDSVTTVIERAKKEEQRRQDERLKPRSARGPRPDSDLIMQMATAGVQDKRAARNRPLSMFATRKAQQIRTESRQHQQEARRRRQKKSRSSSVGMRNNGNDDGGDGIDAETKANKSSSPSSSSTLVSGANALAGTMSVDGTVADEMNGVGASLFGGSSPKKSRRSGLKGKGLWYSLRVKASSRPSILESDGAFDSPAASSSAAAASSSSPVKRGGSETSRPRRSKKETSDGALRPTSSAPACVTAVKGIDTARARAMADDGPLSPIAPETKDAFYAAMHEQHERKKRSEKLRPSSNDGDQLGDSTPSDGDASSSSAADDDDDALFAFVHQAIGQRAMVSGLGDDDDEQGSDDDDDEHNDGAAAGSGDDSVKQSASSSSSSSSPRSITKTVLGDGWRRKKDGGKRRLIAGRYRYRTYSASRDHKFKEKARDHAHREELKVFRAIDMFNKHPRKGVAALIAVGLVKRDAVDIATFFHECRYIDKVSIGAFISEDRELNGQVLEHFIRLLDFKNVDFDMAVRRFLYSFRLPGEGQRIDRLMRCFATEYYEQNYGSEGTVFADARAVHSLAFALIMLNTDAHNKSIRDKMTLSQFTDNVSGHNSGTDFPRDFLAELYEKITTDEIKMSRESDRFPNAIKKGWLHARPKGAWSWSRRWFVLSDSCLYCFRKPTDVEPRFTLALSNLYATPLSKSEAKGRNFCFLLHPSAPHHGIASLSSFVPIFVAGASDTEISQWVRAIDAEGHPTARFAPASSQSTSALLSKRSRQQPSSSSSSNKRAPVNTFLKSESAPVL
jgi:Sec7 domain/PH domain